MEGTARRSHLGFVLTINFRRSIIAVLSWLLAGCLGPAPLRTVTEPVRPLAELKQRVVEIRGLHFKFSPGPPYTSGSSNTRQTDGGHPRTMEQLARAYKRVGLLAEADDLTEAAAKAARLGRFAVYDAERDRLVIAPEGAALARALSGGENGDSSQTMSMLALARALQNQRFHWNERLAGLGTLDRRLAFRSLAEGDALLVALSHLTKSRGSLNWAEAIFRFAAELERIAGQLPELYKQELTFHFRDGTQFVQWAFLAKGWDGVNALFADPPVASAQILHPEKYYIRRQAPLRIQPFGLERQMREAAALEETLGEFRVQVLLGFALPRGEAARVAAGWSGDHLSTYRDGDGAITAWITAWSGEQQAQHFAGAFRAALERRHATRMERVPQQAGVWYANLRAGRSMMVETRNQIVLFLDGFDLPRALKVSEDIWRDLDVAPESAELHFDTAKGPAQFARSR